LESNEIILKLKESLENNFGEYGRTNYIIEKLEKESQLPNSDYLYIDRMVKLCDKISVKVPQETEIIFENTLSKDLIKCNSCSIEISLEDKSIRMNDFWFHDKCFEKIPIIESIRSEKSPIIESIRSEKSPIIESISSEKIKTPLKKIRPNYRNVESKTMIPQMIFSGGLLASLAGTTYLLAGEFISSMVGIWGSVMYVGIFQSQIFSKKREKISIVKTGIPGFDSILSAGFKKNSSVAVSGPPGSGKTTFGLQFIHSGAKQFDEAGVFISLSQSVDEIKMDCKSFGWDVEKLIEKGKILIVDLRPFKIKNEVIARDDSLYRGEQIPFEHLTKFILNSIKKIKAKRIVIDSISMLGMQYSNKFHMKQGLQGMIQALENFDVTSILISEFSEKNKIPREWFTTSGIIQLDNQIINNEMKRTIKITKLQGIKHSEHIHPVEIGNDGLVIYQN